ncbi:MAG: hypothetical protein PHI31_15115 [Desulfuromonadaceae bacterium]|nr:hypothetical protein [Desulfuromonadaceae bacterium]
MATVNASRTTSKQGFLDDALKEDIMGFIIAILVVVILVIVIMKLT